MNSPASPSSQNPSTFQQKYLSTHQFLLDYSDEIHAVYEQRRSLLALLKQRVVVVQAIERKDNLATNEDNLHQNATQLQWNALKSLQPKHIRIADKYEASIAVPVRDWLGEEQQKRELGSMVLDCTKSPHGGFTLVSVLLAKRCEHVLDMRVAASNPKTYPHPFRKLLPFVAMETNEGTSSLDATSQGIVEQPHSLQSHIHFVEEFLGGIASERDSLMRDSLGYTRRLNLQGSSHLLDTFKKEDLRIFSAHGQVCILFLTFYSSRRRVDLRRTFKERSCRKLKRDIAQRMTQMLLGCKSSAHATPWDTTLHLLYRASTCHTRIEDYFRDLDLIAELCELPAIISFVEAYSHTYSVLLHEMRAPESCHTLISILLEQLDNEYQFYKRWIHTRLPRIIFAVTNRICHDWSSSKQPYSSCIRNPLTADPQWMMFVYQCIERIYRDSPRMSEKWSSGKDSTTTTPPNEISLHFTLVSELFQDFFESVRRRYSVCD
mmetsp:Transcript_4578/g.17300  ORF Transcript_4578/g.17300 Transcript_4578/m.17300 type:complete len:491 (-) Transcript_4578:170-1642(-)